MTPGDTRYILHATKKNKPPVWCRCTVQELHSRVARVRIWDGKAFVNRNCMKSDLRETNPQP